MSTPTPPPYGGSSEQWPQDQRQWQQPGEYGPQYPPQGYGQPGTPGYPPKGYIYGYDGNYLRLADWGERVGASLIDGLVSVGPILIGYGVLFVDIILKADDPDALPSVFSIVVAILGLLGSFGLALWNRVFRQGRTGQSVGKSALKIKLIDASTHQPIGAGRSFLRDLLSGIFNYACYINLLWPLWDEQKQTWHDKVMTTYVIDV